MLSIPAEVRRELTVEIHQCYVGPADNEGLCHYQTETASAAGDDTDSALEGEGSESPAEMHTTTALNGLRRRVFLLRWMLHLNSLIGPGEITLPFFIMAWEVMLFFF